jgi:hypothetical protein
MDGWMNGISYETITLETKERWDDNIKIGIREMGCEGGRVVSSSWLCN